MMMRTLLCLTLAFALVGAGCVAPKHNVYHVQSDESLDKTGVLYALPHTVLTVEIPVTRTSYKAGPYIGYATRNGIAVPKPLRDKAREVLKNNGIASKTWDDLHVLDSGFWAKRVKEIEEKIEAMEKKWGTKPLSNDDEKKLNELKSQIQELEALISAPEVLFSEHGKLSSKSFKLGSPEFKTRGEPDPNHVYLVETRSGWAEDRELLLELSEMGLLTVGDSHAHDKTADFVVATIEAVAKTVAAAISLTGGRVADAKARGHAAQAKEIAEKISEVRKHRLGLLGGKIDIAEISSPEILDRMLKGLDKIEEELLANFWSKSTTPAKIVYECTPEDGGVDQVLFHFDNKSGLYPEEKNNKPVVAIPNASSFKAPSKCGQPVKLTIKRQPQRQFSQIVHDARKRATLQDELGFRYRIPALATAEVTVGGKPIGRTRTLVAQFGAVDWLPAGFDSIDSRIIAKFYEATGALKSVEVKTKSLDPALAEKLGTAGETLAKAYAARRAAKAQKPSRLKRLTERLVEFQELVKTAGTMGIPVPAWALDAPVEEGGD